MEKNDYVDSAISALEFAAEAMIDAYFLLSATSVGVPTGLRPDYSDFTKVLLKSGHGMLSSMAEHVLAGDMNNAIKEALKYSPWSFKGLSIRDFLERALEEAEDLRDDNTLRVGNPVMRSEGDKEKYIKLSDRHAGMLREIKSAIEKELNKKTLPSFVEDHPFLVPEGHEREDVSEVIRKHNELRR